jgi:hypothetical protein
MTSFSDGDPEGCGGGAWDFLFWGKKEKSSQRTQRYHQRAQSKEIGRREEGTARHGRREPYNGKN